MFISGFICLTGRVNLWKKYFAHKAKKEKTRQQLVPFSNGQIFCKLISHKPILKLILHPNLVPRALFPGFGGEESQGKAPWGRDCLHPRSGTLGTRNLQAAGRQLRNLTDPENVHKKSLAEAVGLSCLRQVFIVTHPFFFSRIRRSCRRWQVDESPSLRARKTFRPSCLKAD